MKVKILKFTALATLIITRLTVLYGMEPEPMEIDLNMITLVGSDNKEVQIPRELAIESSTIKGFLEGPGPEAKSRRIEFSEIPSADLQTIFDLQQAIVVNATKRPEDIGGYITSSVQEIVDNKLTHKNPKEIQDLLLASNFLDLSLLKNPLARLYVYRQPKVPLEELKKGIAIDLYDLIEKQTHLRDANVQRELTIADYIAQHGQPIIITGFVDLSSKNISSLDGIELLKNKDAIKILRLPYNMIIEIPAEAFKVFTNLISLDLNNNQLTEISDEAFKGLTNLKILYLSYNQLTEISAEAFKWLTNLEYLWLNYNQLAEIPAEAFKGLTNLKGLYLGYNQLTEVSAEAFKWLTNLKELYLSDNQLTEIPTETFKGFTNLKGLYLVGNMLTEIPAEVFNELTNLEILSLNRNKLTKIPEKAFKELTNLEELDLEDNKLSLFSTTTLEGLKLERLKLRKNKFSKETKTIIRKYCHENNIDLEI